MVSRECVYYINLRQAYLLSDFHANRLSSRTVLYTNVPRQYLDESRLRWVLGKSVKRIWMPQTSDELDKLVKEREQTAMRLEKAEFALIRMANIARNRALKKGLPPKDVQPGQFDPELDDKAPQLDSVRPATPIDVKAVTFSEASDSSPGSTLPDSDRPLPNVNGAVASQWLSHSSRPHHRPIANAGRRVDTIKWTRNRIKLLNSKIRTIRRNQIFKTDNFMPSVFVEFETHTDAQNAYQTLTHHRP